MKSMTRITFLVFTGIIFTTEKFLGQIEMTTKHLFPVHEDLDNSAVIDKIEKTRGNALETLKQHKSSITTSFDTTLAKDLQYVIDFKLNSLNLMGISAAVSVPGMGVWTGVSGVSDTTNENIRPDMIFGIGSVTKTFTAALTLQLVEEGRLSLDDSLYKWLPSYQYIDSTITIRQLLNHTSGIDDFLNNNVTAIALFDDPEKFWTPEAILTSLVEPPAFIPGNEWGYSNTNYIILGMIINQITQRKISEEMRDRFWRPLGMNSTFLAVEDSLAADRPHNWSFNLNTEIWEDYYDFPLTAIHSMGWTAGSIFATAENLVRFSDALYGGELLSQSSINQMVTIEPPSIEFGLGTYVMDAFGRKVWGHSGHIFAFIAALFYSQEDGVSVAICLNSRPGDVINIYRSMFGTIINYLDAVGVEEYADNIPQIFELHQNYPNPFNPSTTIKYQIPSSTVIANTSTNLSTSSVKQSQEITSVSSFSRNDNVNVTLRVYDILGREVATLVNENQKPGSYEVTWNGLFASGGQVPSGVYFYQLSASASTGSATNFVETKKMLMIK